MASPVLPSINEDLFIPEVIDFNLEHNAEQPFFLFWNDSPFNSGRGITVITHLEFGRAAHRAAHLLRPERTGADRQVVAFIALTDTILYQAITAGLIIAGFIPFPISSRNSPAAIVDMLWKTGCHRLIATQTTLKPLLDGIKARYMSSDTALELQVEEIPSLAAVYPILGGENTNHPFRRYPPPQYRPSRDDTCIYIHSSGSTGYPKAIPQTYLSLARWALFPSVTDIRSHVPRLVIGCMALPPFHTLGICSQLLGPLYGIMPTSVYPPIATSKDILPIIPSPENILQHTKRTGSNVLLTIPALIQTWSMSDQSVDFLKSLEFLIYAGGSLPPRLGDMLVSSGVRIRPIYGATEFGAPSHIIPFKGDESDWQYMRFHKNVNLRWIPQGDGAFECQVLTWEKHQSMVENLSDERGYATSDLWKNHPTKKYLWKIVGRLDDVIVHSSGEKTIPAPMEEIIMSSPLVQGTLMFGRERDQSGIIIEPTSDHEINVDNHAELAVLRDKLWPIVEEANREAPAFSRIFKEMILITAKNKPLPRTGKGTIMRKAGLEVYGDEIKASYEAVDNNIRAVVIPPMTWNNVDIEDWLVKQAADLISKSNISPSADLFEQGLDSLSATSLRHRIIGALQSSHDETIKQAAHGFVQNTIYSYPSAKKLAAHILALVSRTGEGPIIANRHIHIDEMIEKYSKGLQPLHDTPPLPLDGMRIATILLTGSTGSLGSQILSILLKDSRVGKVFALNRQTMDAQTVLERHCYRFKDRGLDVGLLNSRKLVLLSGDIGQPNLGLDPIRYSQICDTVNVIIHAAWKLDFNLSLASFEPNIKSTRHLIDLARSGPNVYSTRFLFTSSIGAVQGWDPSRGPVPEEVVTDATTAVGCGYGEGKYVADRILARSGLRATSFRIGQISGSSPTGAWATSDWFPILVKSSLVLGALPVTERLISWLPMNAVVQAIVDVAFIDGAPPSTLNLVHPQPVEWSLIISSIRDAIKKMFSIDLMLVPFRDWISRLETRATSGTEQDMVSIPAIKLLDFFRNISYANDSCAGLEMKRKEANGFPTLVTGKIQEISTCIRELGKLDGEDALLWVQYWRDVGFI